MNATPSSLTISLAPVSPSRALILHPCMQRTSGWISMCGVGVKETAWQHLRRQTGANTYPGADDALDVILAYLDCAVVRSLLDVLCRHKMLSRTVRLHVCCFHQRYQSILESSHGASNASGQMYLLDDCLQKVQLRWERLACCNNASLQHFQSDPSCSTLLGTLATQMPVLCAHKMQGTNKCTVAIRMRC